MTAPDGIVGRDGELARLVSGAVPGGRRARLLLVEGNPGIGKTALLDALARRVGDAGALVLRGEHQRGLRQAPFESLAAAVRGLPAPGPADPAAAPTDRARSCLATFLCLNSGHTAYFLGTRPPGHVLDVAIRLLRDAHDHAARAARRRLSDLHLQLEFLWAEKGVLPDLDLRGEARRVLRTAYEELPDEVGAALAQLAGPAAVTPLERTLGFVEPELTHPERRAELFTELVRGAIGAAAWIAPIVFLVDDLHWAQNSTLTLLAGLVERDGGAGFTVVGTCRPREDLTPAASTFQEFRDRADTLPQAELLRLGRLTEPATVAMVASRVGAPADSPLVRSIADRSEGNPLFATALARYALESSATVRSGDDPAGTHAAELPEGIAETFEARLALLPPEALTVLRGAAVVGREFPYALAGEVVGTGGVAAAIAVQSAVENGMLDELPWPSPGGADDEVPDPTHTFTHGLLVDAVYARMSEALRRELHGAAAKLLEGATEDPFGRLAPTLASHHLRSRYALRAIPYLLADGLRKLDLYDAVSARESFMLARRVSRENAPRAAGLAPYVDLVLGDVERWAGDLEAAARLYGDVLDGTPVDPGAAGTPVDVELLSRVTAPSRASAPSDREPTPRLAPSPKRIRSDALLGLGRIAIKRGEWEDAWPRLEEALALAVGDDDPTQEARVLRSRVWALLDRGRLPQAVAESRRCLALVHDPRTDLPLVEARAMGDLGRAVFLSGDIDRAASLTEDAAELARRNGDEPARAILLNNLGRSHHILGRWVDAERFWTDSRETAERVGDHFNAGFAISNLAKVACDLGEPARALDLARLYAEQARAEPYPYGESIALLTQCQAHLLRGEEDAATEALTRALWIQRTLDMTFALPHGLLMAGRYHHHVGQFRRSLACLRLAAAGFDAVGDTFSVALSTFHRAWCLQESGDTDGCLAEARRLRRTLVGSSTFRTLRCRLHVLLAQVHRERADEALAGRHARAARRMAASISPEYAADVERGLGAHGGEGRA